MATTTSSLRLFTSFSLNFFNPSRHISGTQQFARVVEVGPRDGLQNEPSILSSDIKLDFIDRLGATGIPVIESTSFVSPKWVPQMGDSDKVMRQLKRRPGVSYPVLVPNIKGFESAVKSGATEIAVFTAASEAFSKKNTNCSVEEGLERVKEVAKAAIENNIKIRGYVSCVVGCPYEGPISPKQVIPVVEALLSLGCYEVSLGDTIGVGTPGTVKNLLKLLTSSVKPSNLAIHCHDTYGQALANILVSLEFGIQTIDASVAGLGGCPYAQGASGNVATEDVVYMLQGMGVETGIDLMSLVETGRWISQILNRQNGSKVGNALKDNKFLRRANSLYA